MTGRILGDPAVRGDDCIRQVPELGEAVGGTAESAGGDVSSLRQLHHRVNQVWLAVKRGQTECEAKERRQDRQCRGVPSDRQRGEPTTSVAYSLFDAWWVEGFAGEDPNGERDEGSQQQ